MFIFCGSSRDVGFWLEDTVLHQRAANVPYFSVGLLNWGFFGDGGASYAMIVGGFMAHFTHSFAYAMMGLMAGDLEKKIKQAVVTDEAERWELWLQTADHNRRRRDSRSGGVPFRPQASLESLPKDRRPPVCALPLDRALVSVGRGWDAHWVLPPRPADRRPKAHVDGGTPASGLKNS